MTQWTNRGKYLAAAGFFQASAPTNFYMALVTDATAPTADTNTLSELTEIASGNGYTSGGYSLNRNSTDFDVLTEDDTNDLAKIQIKDVSWTASGGAIPSSGREASYAVLLTDEATVGNRQVIAWWSLGGSFGVLSTKTLRLLDLELQVKYT